MSIRDREIYLGQSTLGNWIFASVRIEPGEDKIVEFTDHSKGPAPERVAIMFTEIDGRRHRPNQPTDVADKWWLRGGQIPPEDRVIEKPTRHARIIEQAWLTSHLNDMQAACDHMTDEMLNPSDEVLDAYIAAAEENLPSWKTTAFYGRGDALQKWRLANVVCPITGYKWGHAWLARTVDPQVIADLRRVIGNS